jgi:hypothetical protein
MEPEFVEGDRATRLKVFGVVGLLLLLVLVELLTFPDAASRAADPVETLSRSMDHLLIMALTTAPISVGSSIYFMRLAIKVKRAGRWPPPGARVAFRTRIRRGQRATLNWILMVVVAGLLLVPAPALLWGWHVVSRVVSELGFPDKPMPSRPRSSAR